MIPAAFHMMQTLKTSPGNIEVPEESLLLPINQHLLTSHEPAPLLGIRRDLNAKVCQLDTGANASPTPAIHVGVLFSYLFLW